MGVDDVARAIGKLGLAIKLGVRSFTDVDTNPVPKDWTHITKVDPEDEKQLPLLYPLYLRHSSAISVGGSRDVNSTNTEQTFELLDPVAVPVFHEPSDARHVTTKTREYCEFLAIPEVLNGDSTSIVGTLGKGTEYLRSEMVPELIRGKLAWLPAEWERPLSDFVTSWLLESAIFEAYIIQNVDSAAAREAHVTEADLLTATEAAQHALAAEKHLQSPVIYLEYSGTYGGEDAADILAAMDQEISWSRIWYGGGISSREDATAVLEAGADTVVVGNVFHDVASEEADFVERATEALDDDPSAPEIREWVDSTVDVEETSAYRYLSTIPSIEKPARLAAEYLSKSIGLHLLLAERLEGHDAGTLDSGSLESAIRRRWGTGAEGETLPGEIIDLLDSYLSSRSSDGRRSAPASLSHVVGLEPN